MIDPVFQPQVLNIKVSGPSEKHCRCASATLAVHRKQTTDSCKVDMESLQQRGIQRTGRNGCYDLQTPLLHTIFGRPRLLAAAFRKMRIRRSLAILLHELRRVRALDNPYIIPLVRSFDPGSHDAQKPLLAVGVRETAHLWNWSTLQNQHIIASYWGALVAPMRL